MRFDRSHNRPRRTIALRYRAGVAAGLFLAGIFGAGLAGATAARADGLINDAPPPLTTLVKFYDQSYEIAYADTVSLEPVSSAIVRKVGYGHVREVNIATTSSGTYSSDGLVSPHVLYPGIEVNRVYEDRGHHHGYRLWPEGSSFLILSVGRNPVSGNLVFNSVSDRGVRSCSASGSFISCYRTN
ncbi:hypothetical protein [Pelagibacterium halotolerans]|uniref:Uncharacterized protein n=1 Tax=Pelagibacterium halotolerans (strain DSM 22347 / JCM 15775 / CGMCC 1.7692 / B2) TaxID=1082931 RepID=G4RBT6_PELHB|nr:hypothetical protein [Pelagibacterium halotolerans]AEQ50599.1 hypothetical protein KKY_558 [Pelagibacterium halotolerans B2]QJR19458.1 hypothetical protein HKM20_14030 [Pelagibacterium halotolerans]SDZ90735.1 hypothetical protein SAMN05428936_101488 [Pelagibacterium halotolerans]